MASKVQALAENYGKQGLVVVGPSLDAEAPVRLFKSNHGLTYPLLTDAKGSAISWAVPSFPFMYLVGKDRKIIWRGNWEDATLLAAIETALKVPDPEPPKPVFTLYVLKDGRTIRAATAADFGENYIVKDDNGKTLTVAKADVADIKKEEKSPDTGKATGGVGASGGQSGVTMTVFLLKDGKQIRAQRAMDAGDEYSIKNEDGKFMTIKKDDIEKVSKE